MKHHGLKMAGALLAVLMSMAIATPAQTFTSLATFDGTDGEGPVGAIQSTGGTLYGLTYDGGANSNYSCYGGTCGTVFKIVSGQVVSLCSLCSQQNCADGATAFAGLVQASDLNFYGMTASGGGEPNCGQGCGVLFKVATDGTVTTLYHFCSQPNCIDGAGPQGALIQGTDGDLYGTTDQQGENRWGTVFKITRDGKLTTLHSFGLPDDGALPVAALVQASDGNFYGTTSQGGQYGNGTVFRMTRTGEVTILYSFCAKPNCADGWFPASGLVQASDGNLYGTTDFGGNMVNCLGLSPGCGTIFRITLKGKLTTLYTFGNSDGANPDEALIQGTDGNLYGATSEGGNLNCPNGTGCGTVFQITPAGMLTTLHFFDISDGWGPSGLIQATNGGFYGATGGGGDLLCNPPYGCGTIYSLNMRLGPFVTFIVAGGKIGQTGGILGQAFTGTTSVMLNGTPATFTVVSDTFIKATVPPGATTGFVTVTTPTGVLTSNVPFHVIP